MENDAVSHPNEIQKELLSTLKYPKEEVLQDEEARKKRLRDLKSALSLGNLEHQKIITYFEDNEGLKCVDTTIWALTENNVVMKYGYTIPLNRIHKVVI